MDEVFDFVKECAVAQGIDQGSEYALALVIELFFTNMVKYSPESGNGAAIGITKEVGRLVFAEMHIPEVTP